MAPFLDARIPLVFAQAAEAGPADVVLIEGQGQAAPGCDWFEPHAATSHPTGCACCLPRNGAGMALARLILARGRGTGVFFTRVIAVVATPEGRADVLAALDQDPIVSCFCRLG